MKKILGVIKCLMPPLCENARMDKKSIEDMIEDATPREDPMPEQENVKVNVEEDDEDDDSEEEEEEETQDQQTHIHQGLLRQPSPAIGMAGMSLDQGPTLGGPFGDLAASLFGSPNLVFIPTPVW